MEGISSEVMSLAGTLGLGKLIVLYDFNSITIEGNTDLAFTEDAEKRFEAFGFHTISVASGNDPEAIGIAIEEAKAETERPSFIKITTKIGFGVPAKEGTPGAHGEPLGVENVAALRKELGWPLEEPFLVPEEVYEHYRELAKIGSQKEREWNEMFSSFAKCYPELKEKLDTYYNENYWMELFDEEAYWKREGKAEAARVISGKALNYMKNILPNLLGGSADLGPSNKTIMDSVEEFSKGCYKGRNIHYGVRELGMTAIANGMALYGGLKIYAATFFVFVDYMKPMLRLASLMGLPIVSVLTHDSIGVGEDGPTHEPIEQLAMLRALPNMHVFRPADEIETKAAWYCAIASKTTPTCLVLSRQNLPVLEHTKKEALKGGYILEKETGEDIDAIIMASGSEVSLAAEAKKVLETDGYSIRVVSMPCMEVFEEQDEDYKELVLPKNIRKRIAVEALSSFGWGKYVGMDGAYVTMDTFGASAPADELFEKYGFTVENVVGKIKNIL